VAQLAEPVRLRPHSRSVKAGLRQILLRHTCPAFDRHAAC